MADVLRATPCPAITGWRDGRWPLHCTGHVEWTETGPWRYGRCNRCAHDEAYMPARHPTPTEHRPGPIRVTRTTEGQHA